MGISTRVGAVQIQMTLNVTLKDASGATVTGVQPVTLPAIEAAPGMLSFQPVQLSASTSILGRESFGLVVDPISDTMFILHGWDPVGSSALRDVQKSTDGATWVNVPVTNPGIVGRSEFCTLVVAPNNAAATASLIYFMGGFDGATQLRDNWLTTNGGGQTIQLHP